MNIHDMQKIIMNFIFRLIFTSENNEFIFLIPSFLYEYLNFFFYTHEYFLYFSFCSALFSLKNSFKLKSFHFKTKSARYSHVFTILIWLTFHFRFNKNTISVVVLWNFMSVFHDGSSKTETWLKFFLLLQIYFQFTYQNSLFCFIFNTVTQKVSVF